MPRLSAGVSWMIVAGITATKPTTPEIRPSLEFASTSSRLVAHDRRDDRRLADDVRLLQHEGGEHHREQREVVDDGDHHQAQPDAAGGDDQDRRSTTAGDAVERRADQRGEDEERREAEDEEQQHPVTGGVRLDREEQRVGEGHDHRRVAGHHHRVGDRQPAELRVPGHRQRPPRERDRRHRLGHATSLRARARATAAVGRRGVAGGRGSAGAPRRWSSRLRRSTSLSSSCRPQAGCSSSSGKAPPFRSKLSFARTCSRGRGW